MAVGYLPDQFGHTAQMPQLLRLRGIETAVVWRGVPDAEVGGVFDWESPDGSSVRTVHLQRGYGHGRGLPLAPAALRERLKEDPWATNGMLRPVRIERWTVVLDGRGLTQETFVSGCRSQTTRDRTRGESGVLVGHHPQPFQVLG